MVDGFERVKGLDAAALRGLLAAERPEQRAWAAWELSLRAGSALPHVVDHIGKEPSAGVRRLLLPVLAGHGEVDILVALARHDPAVEVRGAAWLLVARLIEGGRIDRAVLIESYAVEGPVVRAAILGALTSIQDLPLVVDVMATGAADEQLEAFAAALRIATPDSRRIAFAWLVAHPAGWPRLGTLPPDATTELLATASRVLPVHKIVELSGLPLATLSPLIKRGDELAFQACRKRGFAFAPAELLARGILSGFAFGFLEALACNVTGLEASTVVELRAYIKHRMDELAAGRPLPDEQPGWRWPARYHYGRLLEQLG